MSDLCPHCGVHLPVVRDAFCSECRESLDEMPVPSPIQAGNAWAPGGHSNLAEAGGTRQPTGGALHHQASYSSSDITGAETLTWEELADEIRRGGRLVIYQFCISLGIVTLLRPSKMHLVRVGESAVAKGLPYTVLSLLAGWWGFPWGFIYTPLAVAKNLAGGTDVTATLVSPLPPEGFADPFVPPTDPVPSGSPSPGGIFCAETGRHGGKDD